MKRFAWMRWVSMPLACALLAACAHTAPAPGRAPSSPPARSAAATTRPAPAQTTTPTPAPVSAKSTGPDQSPSPAPTPTPTPTQDPWAEHFTAQGAYVCVKDADAGPWIYKDETLSIRIDIVKTGRLKYCRAEIYTRGPLPGGCFAYNDAKMRKTALPYLIARQNDAVFGITADMLAHRGNPKGVMIRKGAKYFDRKQAPTLAVLPDGSLKVFEPGETSYKKLAALGVRDSFSFGPILVKDGKIHKSVYTHPLKPGNWRSAIGQIEPGHYICVVTLGGFTLHHIAQLFIDNKCTLAYNLDGGHSASMVFMGEQLYRGGRGKDGLGQRAITDILTIGSNPAVPDPGDPVYCNGVTKNKKNRPKPTDGPLS
jgi:hypothetical protein